MPEDGEKETTVQTKEQVSQEEQVSTNAETEQENETAQTQKALTEEKVQQMIADATAKAVQKAKEAGRRELQSQQDRNKAEVASVERRAKLAEKELEATGKSIASLDPEIAKEVELARLRAKSEGRDTLESEEVARTQSETYTKALKESLETHLDSLGIPKDDPRIDWATNAPDYLSGRARFDTSVAKIVKANQEAAQSSLEKRLKALEEKSSEEETEANSVETTASTGAVAKSDVEFKQKFGSGALPYTKENVDRYNKLLSQE